MQVVQIPDTHHLPTYFGAVRALYRNFEATREKTF